MKTTVMKTVRRGGSVFLAGLVGISTPLLIWVAIVIALRQIFAEWRAIRCQLLGGNLVCNLDTDCPPGYACIDGRCLPARAW